MDSPIVVYYYSDEGCEPCEEVVTLLKKGKVKDNPKVELVDIATDEGFDRFQSAVLSKGEETGVPIAFRDGQACQLLLDTDLDKLVIECPCADEAFTGAPDDSQITGP